MPHSQTTVPHDTGYVRATVAYIAVWVLVSLSAAAYITHLAALFR